MEPENLAPETNVSNWHWEGGASKLWLGVAVGIAVGLGFALTRRKKTAWEQARESVKRRAEKLPDFAETTRDIIERTKGIQQDALKVVRNAGELWAQGRKLVRG